MLRDFLFQTKQLMLKTNKIKVEEYVKELDSIVEKVVILNFDTNSFSFWPQKDEEVDS